jgi:hypothetical protein
VEWYPPPGSGQLRGHHVSRAGRGGDGVVPTSRLRTAPRVPRVTGWKRGRWSGTRLPAQDSSGAAMCHLGCNTRLPTQGSFGGAACPRGSGSHPRLRTALGAPHVMGQKRGWRPDQCGGGVIRAMAGSGGGSRISTATTWIWCKGGRSMRA